MRVSGRFLHTDGRGLWSPWQRAVRLRTMVLRQLEWDQDDPISELRVYFDTRTWDVERHGLIYTDPLFIRELWSFLGVRGPQSVDYSEQGMQGDDYVSLDVSKTFARGWQGKRVVE